MELAIKEIKSRISCYDYWFRSCQKYFGESTEAYESRKNELKETRDQLIKTIELIKQAETL